MVERLSVVVTHWARPAPALERRGGPCDLESVLRPSFLPLCFPLVALFLAPVQALGAPGAKAPAARGKGAASATPAAPRVMLRPTFDKRTGLAEPSLSALVAASNRGDRIELTRLAERIGVARLFELLSAPEKASEKAHVLAALDAVRFIEGGIGVLGATARLLGDGDSKVSERAARTLGDLLRADRLDKLAEWEIPGDEVSLACQGLLKAAEGSGTHLPTRVAAIEALGEAHAFCRGHKGIAGGIAGMSADESPEMRRAALLAPQIVKQENIETIGSMTEDAVPLVAGAAAVVWCRVSYEGLRKGSNSETDKRRLFRLRMLVLADIAPVEDTAEILPCLALSKDPEDQKAADYGRRRQAPAAPGGSAGNMQRW